MPNQNSPQLPASDQRAVASDYWNLKPGRTLSLRPREAGVLRVAQGRVWATLDSPHTGHGNESGDYFLHSGERLAVRAGQHLVVELWGEECETRVYFERGARRVAGFGLGLGWGLRIGLDWRAFSAASKARRAQGAISCGDSIASDVAL